MKNIENSIKILLILIMSSCEDAKFSQGQRIYTAKCANCHMDDGSGLNQLIPALKDHPILENVPNTICTIVHGVNADSLGLKEKYMPSFRKIKDVELTNLINYIQQKFSRSKKEYNLKEISTWRKACH